MECAVNVHFNCVSDVKRSPFFQDTVLSVGGWSLHIWKEGTKVPVLSYYAPVYLISACWSPTRPSVFFLARADGKIEIWDLLDKLVNSFFKSIYDYL